VGAPGLSSWLKGLKQHEISAEITRDECILSGQPARLAVICAAKPCQTWCLHQWLWAGDSTLGKRHIEMLATSSSTSQYHGKSLFFNKIFNHCCTN
jgi:hypothetical protein